MKKIRRKQDTSFNARMAREGVYMKSSQEEQEVLRKFYDKIDNLNVDFVEYIKERTTEKAQRGKKVTKRDHIGMNNLYSHYLVLQCIAPLRQGVNIHSVMMSLSMYAGICIADPALREQSLDAFKEMAGGYFSRLKAEGTLPPWAEKWMDKLGVDKWMPLTPDSAALQQIGMLKSAYEQMREPGANIRQILDDYQVATAELKEHAAECGVPADILHRRINTMVYRMIERNPEDYVYFQELCMDGVHRGSSHEEIRVGDDGHTMRVNIWDGDYYDENGELWLGDFTPRPPFKYDQIVNHVSDSVYADLLIKSDRSDFTDKMAFTVLDDYIDEVAASQFDWGDMEIKRPGESVARTMRTLARHDLGSDWTKAVSDGIMDSVQWYCRDVDSKFIGKWQNHVKQEYGSPVSDFGFEFTDKGKTTGRQNPYKTWFEMSDDEKEGVYDKMY